MLGDVAARRKQRQLVMLDLDDGMHRTGIQMDREAVKLYREIDQHPFLEAAGLHLYDGHKSFCDVNLRAEAALRHIGALTTRAGRSGNGTRTRGGGWSRGSSAGTTGGDGGPARLDPDTAEGRSSCPGCSKRL